MTATTLTLTEQTDLERLESIVISGLATFVEVGQALTEIRDKRLYKSQYVSFDSYCRERWGFARRHGDRLIRAVAVVDALGPVGLIPQSERVARDLAMLPPEQQRLVWAEATAEGQQPTSAMVRTLTRQALESLPPEVQREIIEREERQIIRRAGVRQERDRLAQIERLTKRLRKLVEGLGPEGEEPVRKLDEFWQLVGTM